MYIYIYIYIYIYMCACVCARDIIIRAVQLQKRANDPCTRGVDPTSGHARVVGDDATCIANVSWFKNDLS